MEGGDPVERFRAFLADSGLKFTKQRRVVASVFFEEDGHHSLGELHALAVRVHPSIGFATVYRTMKLLVDSGLAAEHKFAESGHVRYEPAVDGEHHDHLICVDCGFILEFEDERIEELQLALARGEGFEVVRHRHEIYGRCTRTACPNRDPDARVVGEHIGLPEREPGKGD